MSLLRSGGLLVACCVAAAPMAAQDPAPRATLRGGVVASETGERIPFAVVVLDPGFTPRFTDDAGIFTFGGVTPGSYRLVARQVGFVPFDSLVTVTTATPSLRIELRRIAVELRPITVSAAGACLNPGPPDSSDRDLAVIFDQLRQNAARYELLAQQYPHAYRLLRQLTEYRQNGDERTTNAILEVRSAERWRYAPGRVVTDVPGEYRTKVVHLPTLPDFADSAFHATHCFRLAGTDSVAGRPYVRIDFRADERLRRADVNGSAFLDPVSYQVRHTSVSVTRLEAGIAEWTANTAFRELAPNVIVLERVSAITTMARTSGRRAVTARLEEQRLIGVTFERPLPTARDSTRQ